MLAGFDVNDPRGRGSRVALAQDRSGPEVPRSTRRPHAEPAPAFRSSRCPLARHEDIDAAGRFLFEHGIYVTLAAYPLVPKTEVGFRIQVTAANSQAEIEQLVDVLGKLAAAFDLRPQTTEFAA